MKQQRQTSKFKAQVVLELLKGETLEELSRKYAVAVSEINTRRDESSRTGRTASSKEMNFLGIEMSHAFVQSPIEYRTQYEQGHPSDNTRPEDNVSDGKNNPKLCDLLKYLYFCNSINNKKSLGFFGAKTQHQQYEKDSINIHSFPTAYSNVCRL